MKKIITLCICLLLTLSCCLTANAAGTASLSGDSSVSVGSNITLTLSVKGCPSASSASVSVSFGSNFELVSGQWLKSGSLKNFDKSTKKGAIGGLDSSNINGSLFKLTLKAKKLSTSGQTVKITVTAKNGSSQVMSATASKTVKIVCASHAYGSWAKVDNTYHKRTCTVCGEVKKAKHGWNAGTVTKEATCNATGVKSYACKTCGATKTEKIKATGNHQVTNATVTKPSTCLAAGTQSGKCTSCGKTVTTALPLAEHTYGDWTVTLEPTCTEAGQQAQTCQVCATAITQELAPLDHDFGEVQVVQEATIGKPGLKQSKCSRCEITQDEVIPCMAQDAQTGMIAETEEGVLPPDTQLMVEIIEKGHKSYRTIARAMRDVSTSYTIYDISALLAGVPVEPEGEVAVSFPIAAGFGGNLGIFRVGDDGALMPVEGLQTEDAAFLKANLEQMGQYILADLDAVPKKLIDVDAISQTLEKYTGFTLLAWVAAVEAVIIFILLIVISVLSKKKKKLSTLEALPENKYL